MHFQWPTFVTTHNNDTWCIVDFDECFFFCMCTNQEFRTNVSHAEWTYQFPRQSNKNLNKTYKMDITVGSWYLFFSYPMASASLEINVTCMYLHNEQKQTNIWCDMIAFNWFQLCWMVKWNWFKMNIKSNHQIYRHKNCLTYSSIFDPKIWRALKMPPPSSSIGLSIVIMCVGPSNLKRKKFSPNQIKGITSKHWSRHHSNRHQ